MKPESNKLLNLILDLDETIIHSLSPDEKESLTKNQLSEYNKIKDRYKHSMGEGDYTVIERPDLQQFLDFAFENFNVSVWTAASKEYALFIIDEIILVNKPERHLDLVLFSTHCGYAKKKYRGMKNLKMVQDVCGYDMDKTVLLDDHPEVYLTQPTNCIRMCPFELAKNKRVPDDFLIRKIIPALKDIISDYEVSKITNINDNIGLC
jgi:TFIIF-interacting CTD phosphatase-like protein